MQEIFDRLIHAALTEIAPNRAIHKYVRIEHNLLKIADRQYDSIDREIRCIAVGKGAIPMARAIARLHFLGLRIDRGLIITKHAHLIDDRFPSNWETIEAGHPIPDEMSLHAGDRAWEFLDNCTDRTLVLACISGGASSLLVAPKTWQSVGNLLTADLPNIDRSTQQLLQTVLAKNNIDPVNYNPHDRVSLDAVRAIGSALLASGLPIEKINAVRSQIDRLKAGGMVDRIGAGETIGLILSDVVGDPIESIASGLTYHPRAHNLLVGNNRQACEAIAQAAQIMGYDARIMTTELTGEASDRGREIAREIIKYPSKTVLIYGGETTVTLPENCQGKGGRNQELGLAAAIELANNNIPAWIATLATDGTDGPTDAAGVTVNDRTIDRAICLGLDARATLANHDSYPFFQTLGDLRLLGATGTNVADMTIAIRP